MEFSEKKECIERLEAAFTHGGKKELETVLTPDFVIYEDPGVPYGGVYHGADGFLSMFGKLRETWATLNIEKLHMFDEPGKDAVLAVVRVTGTAQSDGHPLEAINSEMWRIRDGRIYEGRVWYWDAERLKDPR